ncbi:MAG: hypothetical protein AAB263_15310 [Planctomycetota bacterium]
MQLRPFLNLTIVPALVLGALALSGCGETTIVRGGGPKELTGRWSAVDAAETSKEIVELALNAAWIDNFKAAKKRNPIVVIGKFIPRADGEVITTDVFVKELRNALINSGKVDILDDADQTRKILEDQAAYAAKMKEMGQEAAADYVLKGTINCQNDYLGRKSEKAYFVDFELTDVQTRKLTWADRTKPIYKSVEQSRFRP